MRHDEAANVLLEMRRTGRIEPNLPVGLRPANLGDAYAIQAALVARLLPPGEAAIGYKCACTSEIAQEALRIDRPVFGRMMPQTTSPSGCRLPAADFTHRVIEAEFGIRIGDDFDAARMDHTSDSVVRFIEAVIPSIEIVDHRYTDWAVGALAVAADNAVHGWWIHGEPVTDWSDLNLGTTSVSVSMNGKPVTSGDGTNALGHPLNVVAWLANELPRFGLALKAGDLITTGVVTDVFEAGPGDSVVADFDGMGSVELSFV